MVTVDRTGRRASGAGRDPLMTGDTMPTTTYRPDGVLEDERAPAPTRPEPPHVTTDIRPMSDAVLPATSRR